MASFGMARLRRLGLSKEVIALAEGNEVAALAVDELIVMFGSEDAWREVTVERVARQISAIQARPQQRSQRATRVRYTKYLYIT
jgi:hypothetical protein